MTRVLTIITYYWPHWTGLTAHAVRVAEGLAARNMAVTVLTTRHAPELARAEIVNGVHVVRLRPLMRVSRGMIAPAFPLVAARLIRQHDVVQIHTPLPEALLVAFLCRLLRRPLLMTHHGDLVMPRGVVNRAVQHIGHSLLLAAGRLAAAVTAYSRDYAEHSRLLRPLAGKLVCIAPPVDLPAPLPAAVAEWRAGLGLADKVVIGFAGRWVEEKGFDRLLRALPAIHRTYPRAHLVYAGETDVVYENFYRRCRHLLEARREHLTLLGLIRDRQQMANFYAMCDLFVQPSRTDMMGLVQIEAMLSGTPVVTSDIPGARVPIRDTGFGKLAVSGDPGALALAITEVLSDPERYRPRPRTVRATFDCAKTLAEYRDVLEGLITRSTVSRRDDAPAGAA